MFAGFRSRWTMPFSWAASSASAICRAIASASAIGRPGVSAFATERSARRLAVALNGPPLIGDPLRERLALDQFQHEAAHAVRFLDAVDRPDVRMIQRGEHPRFALEARTPLRVGRERRRQDFDRDLAPERVVVCAVHLAHATDAEQRANRVDAETLTDECALRVQDARRLRRQPLGRS